MKTKAGKTLKGPFGDAQQVIIEIEDNDPPDARATVSTWIIDAPGQSPAWRHYLLSMVHLRDIPGATPVEHRVPRSTHQLFIFAMVPDVIPDPADTSTWQHMVPGNVCEEIELTSDDDAIELAEHCADAIVHGYLPAEPPFILTWKDDGTEQLHHHREPWRTVLIRTSAHYRGEEHAHG